MRSWDEVKFRPGDKVALVDPYGVVIYLHDDGRPCVLLNGQRWELPLETESLVLETENLVIESARVKYLEGLLKDAGYWETKYGWHNGETFIGLDLRPE